MRNKEGEHSLIGFIALCPRSSLALQTIGGIVRLRCSQKSDQRTRCKSAASARSRTQRRSSRATILTGRSEDHRHQHGRTWMRDGQYFHRTLWRTVKYEEIYLKDYRDVPEAMAHLKIYFGFYNHEHPHQAAIKRRPRSTSKLG